MGSLLSVSPPEEIAETRLGSKYGLLRRSRLGYVAYGAYGPLLSVKEYISYRKAVEEQQKERERIAAKRDVAIRLIESEREIILEYFAQRFAERKVALNGFFDILHTAVQEKDEHAMDTALSGILGFETFRQAWADNRVIEI